MNWKVVLLVFIIGLSQNILGSDLSCKPNIYTKASDIAAQVAINNWPAYPNWACYSFHLAEENSSLAAMTTEIVSRYCKQKPFLEVCDLPKLISQKEILEKALRIQSMSGDPIIQIRPDFDSADIHAGLWNIVPFIQDPGSALDIIFNYIVREQQLKFLLKNLNELNAEISTDLYGNSVFHIGNLESHSYGSPFLMNRLYEFWKDYEAKLLSTHPIVVHSKALVHEVLSEQNVNKWILEQFKAMEAFLEDAELRPNTKMYHYFSVRKFAQAVQAFSMAPFQVGEQVSLYRSLEELSNSPAEREFISPKDLDANLMNSEATNLYTLYRYAENLNVLKKIITEIDALNVQDEKTAQYMKAWKNTKEYEQFRNKFLDEVKNAFVEIKKIISKGDKHE